MNDELNNYMIVKCLKVISYIGIVAFMLFLLEKFGFSHTQYSNENLLIAQLANTYLLPFFKRTLQIVISCISVYVIFTDAEYQLKITALLAICLVVSVACLLPIVV